MFRPPSDVRSRSCFVPALLALSALILLPVGNAEAGYTVLSSSTEYVTFGLYSTNGGSFGAPTWNPDKVNYPQMLYSAGPLSAGPQGTYPTTPFPGLSSVAIQGNSFTLPSSTAAFTNSTSSDPSLLAPHTYGSATVNGTVSANLASKGSALNGVVGTSFNAGTFLNSGDQMAAATAAVLYAHIHGEFLYSGPTTLAKAGAILNAAGYVTPTGFVELATVGSISIGSAPTLNYSMIVGGSRDASNNFAQVSSGPISFNYNGDGTFTTTGSFAANGSYTITSGTKITIDSYLTIIADPGSFIQFVNTDDMPVDKLPDIMAGFGGPQGLSVPEPATYLQLGLGILLSWGALARRRLTTLRGSLSRAIPRGATISLIFLVLGTSNAKEAGAASLFINNSDPTLLQAQSSGFQSNSSSQDQFLDIYDFSGKYQSVGTLPDLGSPLTYSVVFTTNGGTVDTTLTRLTLTRLSGDPHNNNLQVQVHFEGILSSNVAPGQGIYFVQPPSGYFDIVPFLASQAGTKVPSDLSVQILTASVPEPGSITMALIGLGTLGGWATRRRIAKSSK